jgi:ubiquinone/menaquinone biosynthesis C-methylase UbiE
MFGPLSARFREADRPVAAEAEIAWYAKHLPAGALGLDLMCGVGRVLVPLVARGLKVHGVDRSAAMLERCASRLAAAGVATPAFRQDVTQLNLPLRYGAAFIADGAFGLLSDPAAAAAALARIRAHLVAPGLLVVDCRVPAPAVQRLGAPLVEVRTVRLADETQITLRSETTWWADARRVRAENRYAHRRGAQRLAEEHETVSSHWHAPEDMVALARAAGFSQAECGPSPDAPAAGTAFVLTARL